MDIENRSEDFLANKVKMKYPFSVDEATQYLLGKEKQLREQVEYNQVLVKHLQEKLGK